MKALAIDTSTSKFTVAAKNGDYGVSTVYDIGMKQSEYLLPAIDYALEKANLKPNDLDCCVITSGPGSFTGLRLAFAACKALTLANGTPLYTVPTLEAMAWAYRKLPFYVVPLIDAKKNKFYSTIFFNGETILEPGDYEISEIFEKLKRKNQKSKVCGEKSKAEILKSKEKNQETSTEYMKNNTKNPANLQKPEDFNYHLLLVGDDSKLFMERVNNDEKLFALKNNSQLSIVNSHLITDSLFEMAEKMIEENVPPAQDYDAPLYIRASEAEEKLLLQNM